MDAQTSNNLWLLASTALGTILGSATTFFFPKIWDVYKGRYIDPKTTLLQSLEEQVRWFRDRTKKIEGFRFALGSEPPPDKYKVEVLISRLDPLDRRWAIKEKDSIVSLIETASQVAASCRENADEAERNMEHVGNKTFFPDL